MNYEQQYWKLLGRLDTGLGERITSVIASCEFEVEPEFSFEEKYQLLRSLEKECIASGDYEAFSDKSLSSKSVLLEPTQLQEARFIKYVESGGAIINESLDRIF